MFGHLSLTLHKIFFLKLLQLHLNVSLYKENNKMSRLIRLVDETDRWGPSSRILDQQPTVVTTLVVYWSSGPKVSLPYVLNRNRKTTNPPNRPTPGAKVKFQEKITNEFGRPLYASMTFAANNKSNPTAWNSTMVEKNTNWDRMHLTVTKNKQKY